MHFHIRCRKVPFSDEMSRQLGSRLAFALARFDQRIRSVTAILMDLNGPKGGIDKECRLVITLRPRGRVTIKQAAGDFETAIALATGRARHAVSRLLKRRRKVRGKSRRALPATMRMR